MLKVLELFSGIGACSKAIEKLNIPYKIVDSVEIDKYAVKSFNAIHGTNFEPQDITQWDKKLDVDLIIHGSPCQDFSIAGKQAGGDEGSGTRSSLMYETIRIVSTLKPKYVIWENVKNLLSKKHFHNFQNYLDTMEQLGYTSKYQVLDAQNYGIPQHRERVFTISVRNDIENNFNFPDPIELEHKLGYFLEQNVDEKYFLTDKKIDMISKWKCYEKPLEHIKNENDIIGTITTRSGAECGGMKLVYDNRNMKEKLCDSLIENNKVKEFDVIRHSYSNSRMKDWESRNIEKSNEVPTLDTRCDCLGVVVNDNNKLRIRKLTPKECWRLMGFEDQDFEKAKLVNSDAQLYKQAGNSIVVKVLEAILKNLILRP